MAEDKQLLVLALRINQTMMARLDEWRRTEKDLPSRPQAVLRMLDQHLPPSVGKIPPTLHGRVA